VGSFEGDLQRFLYANIDNQNSGAVDVMVLEPADDVMVSGAASDEEEE